MRLQTASIEAWNSAARKWGSPRAAHASRRKCWGRREAAQLTVVPPPQVEPAMMFIEPSSLARRPPFS